MDTGLTLPYPVPVLIASLQLDGRTCKVRGHVSCCVCLAPDTTRLQMPGSRRKGREERNWRKGTERREGREDGRGGRRKRRDEGEDICKMGLAHHME